MELVYRKVLAMYSVLWNGLRVVCVNLTSLLTNLEDALRDADEHLMDQEKTGQEGEVGSGVLVDEVGGEGDGCAWVSWVTVSLGLA